MRKTKIILAIMVIVALCVGSVVLAEEAATVTAHDYLGEWVDQDGTTNIDITARDEGDGYIVNIQMEAKSRSTTQISNTPTRSSALTTRASWSGTMRTSPKTKGSCFSTPTAGRIRTTSVPAITSSANGTTSA